MNTKEKIEVMQAFEDGKDIECREDCQVSQWSSTDEPCWAWNMFDYRIKPKEISLEDRVKAEWPDMEVVMLEWDCRDLWTLKGYGEGVGIFLHTTAQTMRNFDCYIYDFDQGFRPHSQPIWPSTSLKPIAVSYSRGEE